MPDDRESNACFIERMGWLLDDAKRRNASVHVGRADFAKLRLMAKSAALAGIQSGEPADPKKKPYILPKAFDTGSQAKRKGRTF